MNVISRQVMESYLRTNQRLSVGLDFLTLLRAAGIATLDQGYSPIILGGAVRDVVFEGRNPNDIDIFLYRTPQTGRAMSRASYDLSLQNIREDLYLWLEDQEIEVQSLLSERAAEYFEGNRFLDILSFVWQGINIQVMIPQSFQQSASSVKQLLGQMPLISGCGITLENVVFTDSFVCANVLRNQNIFPAAYERDYQYLHRKRPEGRLLRINNIDQMIYSTLGHNSLDSRVTPVSSSHYTSESTGFGRSSLLNAEINSLFPFINGQFRTGVGSSELSETL